MASSGPPVLVVHKFKFEKREEGVFWVCSCGDQSRDGFVSAYHAAIHAGEHKARKEAPFH